MKTTKRLTWTTPDGGWGVQGVDLRTVPTKVYGALYKLMEMETIVEQLNDPATEGWEAEELMQHLRSMAPYEPDPSGVEFFDGRRWRAC